MAAAERAKFAALKAIESSEVMELVKKHDLECASALATTAERLLALPDTDLPAVRDELQCQIAAGGGPLHAATVLLSARALGKAPDEQLLAAAAGLELLVCFPPFLLQVNDAGPSSEGKSDNTRAILLADFAVASSLRPLSELPARMVAMAADLACTLSEGVALEFQGRGESGRTTDDLIAIAERLEGASFALAARIGAELAGAPARVADTLSDYGRELGIAFALSPGNRAGAARSPNGIEGTVTPSARHAENARSALDRAALPSPAGLVALAELAASQTGRRRRIAPAA